MPLAINDNGTWRYPKAISVNDSTTWRVIKRLSVNDGGTWRTPFMYIGNMTIAFNGTNTYGFDGSEALGSRSPTTDANGHPVTALTYNTSGGSTDLTFVGVNGEFTGFTQTNYLKLVTVAGVTATTASCSAFFNLASDSVLIWRWATDLFSIQSQNGSNLSLQLTPA